MTQQIKQIPVSSIILDEDIYPRKGIDHKRVAIFAENIRDGIDFDPIEVEPCPDKPGFYRHLDGVHRWSAHKSTGMEEIKVIIKDLDGIDPLLYAAKKAIGRNISHAPPWHPPGQDCKEIGTCQGGNP
jgi:hypothetical protein